MTFAQQDLDPVLSWWFEPGDSVKLTRSAEADPGVTAWQGSVVLPAGTPAGTLRLVVREWETLFAEDRSAADYVPARRLVFADAIML